MDKENQELFKFVGGMFNQNSHYSTWEEQSKMAINLAEKINGFPESTRKTLQNFLNNPSDQFIQENPVEALEYAKFLLISPKSQNDISNAFQIINAVESNLRVLEQKNYPLSILFESLSEISSLIFTVNSNPAMLKKSEEYSAKAYEYGSKLPTSMLNYLMKNLERFGDYFVFQIEEEPIYKDMIKVALEDESGILAYFVGLLLKGTKNNRENRDEALKWFKYSHNCGFLEGTCEVALYYLEASPLIDESRIGLNLLEYAASKNYAEANYILGYCYIGNQVIKKDKKKAREYFQRALELGHPEAQAALNSI